MPDKKTGFLAVTFELLAIAYIVGFSVALFSIKNSALLPRFFLPWELVSAVLTLSTWVPAILLSAAALSSESAAPEKSFAEIAKTVMLPAFALAVIFSVFFLLVVPGLEKTKLKYEKQSQVFYSSIKIAETALKEGRISEANSALIDCGGIDPKNDMYVELAEKVQSRLLQLRLSREKEKTAQILPDKNNYTQDDSNQFYLDALKARAEGRLFDAHYLAKRSLALYSKRPEVRALVEETWRDLEKLDLSKESKEKQSFYKKKLEAYRLFQEQNYLEAYRLFLSLSANSPKDADVIKYLAESTQGLNTISFFVEEVERAFKHSGSGSFHMNLLDSSALSFILSAAAVSDIGETIYFRDLELEISGKESISLSSKFARLHGNTLIVRAVDRNNPDSVWEPIYHKVKDSKDKETNDPGYAIALPVTRERISNAILLSGAPESIPVKELASGLVEAKALGLNTEPLLMELAKRASYPFSVIMLILLGTALGLRFRAKETVSTALRLLSAPLFTVLAYPSLKAGSWLMNLAAELVTGLISPNIFLLSWLVFLSVMTAICLLISGAISSV